MLKLSDFAAKPLNRGLNVLYSYNTF